MSFSERENLVAPCGIDCGVCELYGCRNDEGLKQRLIGRGIPAEGLPCDGCRPKEGRCPLMPEVCSTYACIRSRGVGFCHECTDFPCERLHPSSHRADVLPHNMKVFNLSVIRRDGVDGFVRQSPAIKKRYYLGKMAIGKGPQL